MVTLADLWLPILLSAVIVWVASSIIWMVLPWHKADWRGLPNEEAARNVLRGLSPGQYHAPHCSDWKETKTPEYQRKLQEGPLFFMTVLPNGQRSMGRQMILWMIYLLVTGTLIAYIAADVLPPGTDYMKVFCFTGLIAWLANGWGGINEGVWFGRPWRSVLTLQLDAIIYALLTAGVFGWLWPSTVMPA